MASLRVGQTLGAPALANATRNTNADVPERDLNSGEAEDSAQNRTLLRQGFLQLLGVLEEAEAAPGASTSDPSLPAQMSPPRPADAQAHTISLLESELSMLSAAPAAQDP